MADLLPFALEIDALGVTGKDEGGQRRSLGRKLAKQKKRVIGSHQLVEVGKEHRVAKWGLKEVAPTENR